MGTLATLDGEVFERYAEEAAFLWEARDAAVRAPSHDLRSLCNLDERLEAHLDGLRVSGDEGRKHCEEALAEEEPGPVFVATVLAVDRGDVPAIARILNAGGESAELARGIISALGWAPFDRAKRVVAGLLYPRCAPALHYLGIAAGAAHRHDPGAALENAMYSSNSRLQARALRTAGELGRADLLPKLSAELEAEDEHCRFSAAWSAALLGEPAALPVLLTFAGSGGPHAIRAVDMAMRRMEPGSAQTWLRALARSPAQVRTALAGVAALGDPSMVPWLLELMTIPETARLAGATLSLITGVDFAAEKLKTRQPEGFHAGPTDDPDDEDVAMDPDASLPWPDIDAVQIWWSRRRADFQPATRHLAGKPMNNAAWLGRVLREGSQPARAAAALELSMRQRGRAIFDVRAAGERQRIALGNE